MKNRLEFHDQIAHLQRIENEIPYRVGVAEHGELVPLIPTHNAVVLDRVGADYLAALLANFKP